MLFYKVVGRQVRFFRQCGMGCNALWCSASGLRGFAVVFTRVAVLGRSPFPAVRAAGLEGLRCGAALRCVALRWPSWVWRHGAGVCGLCNGNRGKSSNGIDKSTAMLIWRSWWLVKVPMDD